MKNHYCPNVGQFVGRRPLKFLKLGPMRLKIDLNSKPGKPMLLRLTRKEMADECRQIDLFTTNGVSARNRVSRMRRTLPRRLQAAELLLLGPIPVHGLCPTNVSRKSARYRSLSARQSNQALPHGDPGSSLAQHVSKRQCGTGLAHLFRLRSFAHQPSQRALPQRRFQPGVAGNGLRPRCHHHRLVPFALPLGQVSQAKRGRETSYLARPAGQYSYRNHYYSRPDSRGQHPGAANFRSWRVLSDGPGLSRLSSVAPPPFSLGILCHSRPQKIRLPAALLCAGRPHHGNHVRSNRNPEQPSPTRRLSRQASSHSLFRLPAGTAVGLSDQQLYLATPDRGAALSQSLASGVVLQMDQATSSYQKILRHFGERAQDPDLDCHLRLRARGDCQKTVETRRQSLQNSTDLKYLSFRENPDSRSAFIVRLRNGANHSVQTIDPIPLTLGQ